MRAFVCTAMIAASGLWTQAAQAQTPTPPPSVSIQKATAANTSRHLMYIDDRVANNNPEAVLLVTPHWNPPGSHGVYTPNPIGVWYDVSRGRWAVIDDTGRAINAGAAFNVAASDAVFGKRHVATAANTVQHHTYIDDGMTNGKPNARVFVTHNLSAPGGSSAFHPRPVGVWYDATAGKWSIFNADGRFMPVGTAFNYIVGGSNSFTHHTTVDNTVTVTSLIDDPRLNARPGAIILATHNWNPPGSGGQHNESPLGVWYDSTHRQWQVFNQRDLPGDGWPLEPGTAFNILILN